MKFNLIFFLIILGVSMISSQTYSDCQVYGTCSKSTSSTITNINYSSVNTNNSNYLQGLTPAQIRNNPFDQSLNTSDNVVFSTGRFNNGINSILLQDIVSINTESGILMSVVNSLDWYNRIAYDRDGQQVFTWNNRNLSASYDIKTTRYYYGDGSRLTGILSNYNNLIMNNKTSQDINGSLDMNSGTSRIGLNINSSISSSPNASLVINIPTTLYTTGNWTQNGLNGFTGTVVNDGLTSSNAFYTDSSGIGSILILNASSPQNFIGIQISVSGSVKAEWEIKYSDNNATWTTAYSLANVSGTGMAKTLTFKWSSVGSHKYWMLNKTNVAGTGSYHTEIQFLTNADDLISAQTSSGTGVYFPLTGGMSFKTNNNPLWIIGNDPSDSNQFKLSNSSDIGTGTKLKVTQKGYVAINQPLAASNPVQIQSFIDIFNQQTGTTSYGKISGSSIFLHDSSNTALPTIQQIIFGSDYANYNKVYGAVYFGYVQTKNSDGGKGDFVWGLRNVETDTQPSERMRLNENGTLLINTAIQQNNYVLQVNGSSLLNGNINISGSITTANASSYTNLVVCYLAGGKLGHCVSVVGIDGSCTCNTN